MTICVSTKWQWSTPCHFVFTQKGHVPFCVSTKKPCAILCFHNLSKIPINKEGGTLPNFVFDFSISKVIFWSKHGFTIIVQTMKTQQQWAFFDLVNSVFLGTWFQNLGYLPYLEYFVITFHMHRPAKTISPGTILCFLTLQRRHLCMHETTGSALHGFAVDCLNLKKSTHARWLGIEPFVCYSVIFLFLFCFS